MCFSPQADLVGGIVVTGIGVDACRHLRGKSDHLLLATLPLLLGAHQLIEFFGWESLRGDFPHWIGRIALWAYLLIAFVVLPIFVPLAVLVLEPTRARKMRMVPFLGLGAVVSTVLLSSMLRNPINFALRPFHLAYNISVAHGGIIVVLYVVAICGALLFSGYRDVTIFGLGNVIGVAVLARLTIDGFASMWCGYAALASGGIALHMRYAKAHRAAPYVLI